MAAYLLLVGVPVLGLLGILEAGRNIPAPPSISGDWNVEFDAAASCSGGPAALPQPAMSISQSGIQALITLNDGHATVLDAAINGAALKAKSATTSITASIAGKPAKRTLEGKMNFAGCGPVAFRAVRQAPKKRGA